LKEINIDMEEGQEIDTNTFNIEEEEPPSLIEDHEAEELLKMVSTSIKYKHELKWHLNEAVSNWRDPFTEDRAISDQGKAFTLLGRLQNNLDESIDPVLKMTMIILCDKRISQQFELNQFILNSIIRTIETFWDDDITTASFSEFDRMLYVTNERRLDDITSVNFNHYLQEKERLYMISGTPIYKHGEARTLMVRMIGNRENKTDEERIQEIMASLRDVNGTETHFDDFTHKIAIDEENSEDLRDDDYKMIYTLTKFRPLTSGVLRRDNFKALIWGFG
jgi:hypothetical protein